MNQGVVHESLNLAGLMKLPVVFIIENNGYAFCSSEKRSSATGGSLAQRAEGYGIAWDRCCGDGIYEVRATSHAAIQRAHHESRPTVLEMSTYRYEGFVIADANRLVYRTKAEVMEHITHHDPVKLWAAQLKAEGIVDQDRLNSIYAQAHSEAAEAVAFAKESAYPEAEAIFDHIYWAKDHAEVARPLGRHFF
jgi:pyruvate dehydrogenase E1 component alpha subunit